LFKYHEKTNTKTNLMVFLRPVIVRSAEDSYGFSATLCTHSGSAKENQQEPVPILDDFNRGTVTAWSVSGKKTSAFPMKSPDKIFGRPT
jgi:general secretion pathway protein D